jgi:NTP pyrophosphatase (non-canonical NTP hydrolase)
MGFENCHVSRIDVELDKTTTICDLKECVSTFIDDREWNSYHQPKDLAISISLEAAELLEIFQWLSENEIREQVKQPKLLDKIRKELADILIYSISFANILDIDISQSILNKITENEKKYPVEKVKGKYRKYTELEAAT